MSEEAKKPSYTEINTDGPVEAFGGLSAVEFGRFADEIERAAYFSLNQRGDAVGTLWVHLLCRMILDADSEGKGAFVLQAMHEAIEAEVRMQRERAARTHSNGETKH